MKNDQNLQDSLAEKFQNMSLSERVNELAKAIIYVENHTHDGEGSRDLAEAQLTVKLLGQPQAALAL
jgi:hypothetical protein